MVPAELPPVGVAPGCAPTVDGGAGACAGSGAGGTAAGGGPWVEDGTGAVELAGGITAGGAASRAGAGLLLAAMGAVAQVPTQWSGAAGGAPYAATLAAANRTGSRKGDAKRARRMDRVTATCGPQLIFFQRLHLTLLSLVGASPVGGPLSFHV